MGLIGIILLILMVIASVALIGIVMIQDDQGEGLGGIFGGGSSTPFGSRSGNVLTRFTAILGTIFIVCSFALGYVNRTPDIDNLQEAAAEYEAAEGADDWYNESSDEEDAE